MEGPCKAAVAEGIPILNIFDNNNDNRRRQFFVTIAGGLPYMRKRLNIIRI